MSEAGFDIFNQAFPAVVELLYAISLTLFLHPFLGERRGLKAAAVLAGHLLISLVWDCFPAPQGTFSLVVSALLVVTARFLGLKWAMAFLLGLLFWNTKIASALTVESLFFAAERLLPQPLAPPEAVYLHTVFLLTLLFLSQFVVLGIMLIFLQRLIKKRRLTLHHRELCYLSIVPAAGVLFGQVISNLLIEVKNGVLLELYERHPAFLAVVPALALLFYAGSCFSISFQQSMDALREEREVLFVERQQAQAIRERINEMERSYSQVRGLKHEMRGHLTNLKGLASAGEYDGLDEYIAKMDGSIRDFEVPFQTGNPVTDVIVSNTERKSWVRAFWWIFTISL